MYFTLFTIDLQDCRNKSNALYTSATCLLLSTTSKFCNDNRVQDCILFAWTTLIQDCKAYYLQYHNYTHKKLILSWLGQIQDLFVVIWFTLSKFFVVIVRLHERTWMWSLGHYCMGGLKQTPFIRYEENTQEKTIRKQK